jgi:hypothetical protein
MTREDIAAMLDRVRSWPVERQQDLIQIALQLEEQDSADRSLTDDQLQQVRRIRQEVRSGMVASDAEMAELWRKCGL